MHTRICRIKHKTLCTDGNVFLGTYYLHDLRKLGELESVTLLVLGNPDRLCGLEVRVPGC
jgi:hypothetical protein